MNPTLWQKLQTLDPRILYVLLLFFVTIPLLTPITLPIIPSQQSRDAYNTIEAVAREHPIKPALLDSTWSASTRGENEFQSRAIIQHLMMRHIPIIVLPGDPQAPQLMGDLMREYAPRYGYVYGRDYILIGYKPSNTYTQMIKGMVRSIPDTLKTDGNGTDLKTLPIMRGVNDFHDLSVLVELTPTASIDLWLQFVQGGEKIPIIDATTAVQAPEAFPFLDSGQIQGMLLGVKGAGDYETLLGVKGRGTKVATALSMVYALIIGLIVLGNVGHFLARRAERRGGTR